MIESKIIDLETRLPTTIFAKLSDITSKLALGEVIEAYDLLKKVKAEL